MTDILLIEDDPTIREVTEFHLKLAGFSVKSADNGSSGLALAAVVKPKLIILDLMMPEMNGFEFCKKLRSENEEIVVLVVTALDTEADKLKSFSLGADDYIVKPFSMVELLARIRAHLRRVKPTGFVSNDIMKFGDVRMDPINYALAVGGKPVKLRPKEYQLLAFMASNPGVLISRQTLAEKVWGDKFVASSRTIDVHVRRIRNKIEAHSAFTYITTVHALGYMFEMKERHEES